MSEISRIDLEDFNSRISQIQGLMIYVATGKGDLESKIEEKEDDYKALHTDLKGRFENLRRQGLGLPDRNGFASLRDFQGYWKLKELDWAARREYVNGLYEEVERIVSELINGSRTSIEDVANSIAVTGSTITSPTTNANEDSLTRLLRLLRGDWIQSVVGYFSNHRPSIPYSRLDTEYKVQDLIYCLAASLFSDLQFENPQQKNTGAITSTRVDFSSAGTQLFLEAKLASSRHGAKQVENEISEDIVKYGRQKVFKTLVFFIYCHNYTFPNSREFEQGFTGRKVIDGHQFDTYCIVKP
jgi:hypothetical protein